MYCVSAARAEGGGRGRERMGGRGRDRDGGRAEVERVRAQREKHQLSDFSK